MHPKIQFTIGKETQNKLNYLDLTITNLHNTTNIVRKPTATDLIHNDSFLPQELKKSAINYLINRMNTHPITDINKNHELQHIKTILHNNSYPTHIHRSKHKLNHIDMNTPPKNKQKWATFTYTGIETRIMIRHHLKPENLNSDICQLKCNDCQLKFVGCTGRSFRTHFKEHIEAVRTNKQNSKFAQHILDAQYTYDNDRTNSGHTSH
jgi:hypothetical protein